jgi:pimeloyl-ACP methyl ester carboxylesterase
MALEKFKRKKEPSKGETVVLLHGILRTGGSMRMIKYRLEREGYDVIAITYPSNKQTLEQITDYVHGELKLSDKFNKAGQVHFVTHSMGGLVTRYYLDRHRPAHLGRVVMMGPPNQGSEFADFMSEKKSLSKIFSKLFGPAGQQLRTGHEHDDDEIDYDVGVIAGSRSINPLAPWVLDGEHDGIVPVERTKIDGMKDHIVLPTSHSSMMYSPKVLRQISHFLKNGAFDRAPKA